MRRNLFLAVLFAAASARAVTGPELRPSILNEPHGSSLPTTCNQGDIFHLVTAPSGQRIYSCEAVNAWVVQGVDVVPVGGTPSALVGVAPTGGTSPDFMPADAAPAIDQAMVPTWSAIHTHSVRPVFEAGIGLGKANFTSVTNQIDGITSDATSSAGCVVLASNSTAGGDRWVFGVRDNQAAPIYPLLISTDGSIGFGYALNSSLAGTGAMFNGGQLTNTAHSGFARFTMSTTPAGTGVAITGSGSGFNNYATNYGGWFKAYKNTSATGLLGGVFEGGPMTPVASTAWNEWFASYHRAMASIGTSNTANARLLRAGGIYIDSGAGATIPATPSNALNITDWTQIYIRNATNNTRPVIANAYGAFLDQQTRATANAGILVGMTGIATIALNAGGTGYPASSSFMLSVTQTSATGGFVWATTNSSGVVTTVSLISPGSNYATGTGLATAGSVGSGCTIDVNSVASGGATYKAIVIRDAGAYIHSSATSTLDFTATTVQANADFKHTGTNLGFYNTAVAARPAAYTQTYSTATRTHANFTSATLTDNSGGTANTTVQALTDPADTPITADSLRDDLVANLIVELRNNIADLTAQINALRADLENAKQLLNQVIDDDQTVGLKQ